MKIHQSLQFPWRTLLAPLAAIVYFFATAAAMANTTANEAPVMTVLRGGWMFDPISGTVSRNSGILVFNGQFIEVGADLTRRDLTGARVIDLAENEFALPGLIDMHGHYDVMLISNRRVDELLVNPIVYLANGVTSTYTAGEYDPLKVRAARLRIDRGDQIGPRIFQAGPKFGVASPDWRIDASPNEVRAMVDRWVDLGVNSFKAYGLEREQLQALIGRAHKHGVSVTGHLMGRDDINPMEAVLMGIDRIEHYLGGDAFVPDRPAYDSLPSVDPESAEFKSVAALFLRYRVYFNPTLTRFTFLGRGSSVNDEILQYWQDERALFTPWIQARVRDRETTARDFPWKQIPATMRRALKAFYDMGGADLIMMGTDNPSTGEFLAGFDAHRELQNFVVAGIPESDALKFATINGAKALNMAERLGSIETGKWADLFVVRGNPLQEIRNTRKIRLVMKAGEIYDPAALLESVKGKMGPANEAEALNW